MTTRDRRLTLLASTTTNGVDFVEVASADQTQLRVHFLNTVSLRGTLAPATPVTITGGEVIQTVSVNPVDEATAWSADTMESWANRSSWRTSLGPNQSPGS